MRLTDLYTDKQKEEIRKWIEQQLKKSPKDEFGNIKAGCSGGMFTYEFTPTSLGMVIRVVNNLNKETIDLTQYDMW